MKKFIIILITLCCFFLVGCSPKKVRAGNDCADNLRLHVEYLASDECDGRLPFTEGADRAVAYLVSKMSEMGLEPFPDGSYLQQVPLVKISTEVQDTATLDLAGRTTKFLRGVDFAAFTHSRDSVVDIRDAELFFAGYGIVAPEYGKDDYRGLKNPSNKIAVVIVNDPGLGREGDYFNGDSMTYYGRWTYKIEEAARHGLKGVLIIHDDRGAGYGWDVVNASSVRYDLDSSGGSGCPLEGWLSGNAARRLLADCGYDDYEKLVEEARKPSFRPLDLGARLSLRMSSRFEYASSPNVVGYVPGTSEDENIVCIAHWDHLGHAEAPVDGDEIINGATDNATAMAWLLEMARVVKDNADSLRRNVVFLFPTCEEKGMFGSEFYVSHPVFPVENTVGVINMDVFPLWGENNDVTITGYGQSTFDDFVASKAAAYGRYVMADPDAHNGMFFRSDHLPFMRKGVPALFAKGWSDNRRYGKEWSTEKIADYWANVYHKPCDQTSPADDYSGLVQEVALFSDVLLSIAESDFRPEWKDNSEFADRDRQ